MGAIAAVGAVQMRPIANDARGMIDVDQFAETISPEAGMFQRPRLLCLENTHNRGNGAAFSAAEMQPVVDVAREHGMVVHIDGARIWNAAVALCVPVAELASVADSVSFCLSKGLSCPVGSVVVGDREFIARARRVRKMLGGGMRQAGIIAAAGIVALDMMVERLADDHTNAQRLAKGLADLPGIDMDPVTVETNIVYMELGGHDGAEFAALLKQHGVLANGRFNWVRFVTRNGITAEDVDEALDVVAATVREVAGVR
jgi:threonine aldolase